MFPRDLGETQGLLIKALLGGALVVALVLLIWGPLLFISIVNTTISQPNPPVSASIDVSIEGIRVPSKKFLKCILSKILSRKFEFLLRSFKDLVKILMIHQDFETSPNKILCKMIKIRS